METEWERGGWWEKLLPPTLTSPGLFYGGKIGRGGDCSPQLATKQRRKLGFWRDRETSSTTRSRFTTTLNRFRESNGPRFPGQRKPINRLPAPLTLLPLVRLPGTQTTPLQVLNPSGRRFPEEPASTWVLRDHQRRVRTGRWMWRS